TRRFNSSRRFDVTPVPFVLSDCPKRVELRLPVGELGFVWLIALRACSPSVRFTRGDARLPAAREVVAGFSPMPHERLSRPPISTRPYPVPKFRGMICCAGIGNISKFPQGVMRTLGRDKSVANAGRSLKLVSPFKSMPDVILNAGAEFQEI